MDFSACEFIDFVCVMMTSLFSVITVMASVVGDSSEPSFSTVPNLQ